MTFPLPIRTAGDTATEHVDDHNEIHDILGGGLPTGLTTSSTGHLANHNTIHTILNATEGQSLPTGIAAGTTGHLSHHNTIHTLLNETVAPSSIYGPVDGAAAIRAGAGPDPVSDPGGGISFNSSTNISTLISSNAANSVFVASATGTYPNFRGINYSNKHPRFYFPGNALTDYNITGAGTLNESGISGGSAGIEIYGGKWTGFGSTPSTFGGCIRSDSGPTIIQDAWVTAAGRSGIALVSPTNATTHIVRRCRMSSNGRYNITYSGLSAAQGSVLLEYCLMETGNSNNNDPGGDAGCMKINNSDGTVMRYNWSKNNTGFGIWFDGANRRATVNDNVVENNTGISPITGAGGLFYEIGGGGTVIEHNYVTGNGDSSNNNYPFNGVQIIIWCAPSDGTGEAPLNVRSEIRYNDVDASGFQTPICIFNHSSHGDVRRARNWYVHHNRMYQRGSTGQSRVGLSDQCTVGSSKAGDIGTSPGSPGLNLFDYNEYHVANISGAYWNHDTAPQSPGARTWAQFQAKGHEANGTLTAI